MKTKVFAIILLSIGLNMQAQLKTTTIKKPKLTVNTNAIQLPLLKATNKAKFTELSIENIPRLIMPKSTTTAAPKPNASSSSALNVTLNPTKPYVRNKADIVVSGVYTSSSIHTRTGMIGTRFKAKRNKTYRIKVGYTAKFRANKCSKPMMFFAVGDNTQALSIKNGRNTSEFLVQSDIDEWVFLKLLSKHYLKCNGAAYRYPMSIRLSYIKISELQN